MPKCSKCAEDFPNRLNICGKIRILSSRKYCLKCSPFGGHNTKQIHEMKEAHKTNCVCTKCAKQFVYKRSKGGSTKICGSCSVSAFRKRRKQKALHHLGGASCSLCGYKASTRSLDFHHKNPSIKSFTISNNYHKKWEILKEELDKCIVVCKNCHGELS